MITSDMGRLVLVVSCSLLFAATVTSRALEREKRDKGNIIFLHLCLIKNAKFPKRKV